MEKPYLFLDFDGLQFNTQPILVDYVNEKYRIEIDMNTRFKESGGILNLVNEKRSDLKISFYDFWSDIGKNLHTSIKLHENVLPIGAAPFVIPLLSDKYNIVTVTGRQICGIRVVKYLSEKFFPGCIKDFHFVFRDTGVDFFKISKRDYVEGMFVEKRAFIDDSIDEVLEMKGAVDSFLFSQNGTHSSFNLEGINVLKGWSSIGETFL